MNPPNSRGSDPALRSRSVSTRVASEILGVSESTVRRWFKEGRLDGKEIQRGRKTVYMIDVPEAAFSKWRESVAARPELPETPGDSDVPASDLDRAQAWAQGIVEPLVRALTEQQQQNSALTERIGILRARMDALTREKAAQDAVITRLVKREFS
jgi:hypothetical protein